MLSRYEADDFASICNEWKTSLTECLITIFSVRKDGEWIGRYCSIILSPANRLNKTNNVVFKSNNVFGCRTLKIITEKEISKLLLMLSSREFLMNEFSENVKFFPDGDTSIYYNPEHHPDFPSFEKVPTIQIRGRNYISNSIDSMFLDEELRTADFPYDGLEDLLYELDIPLSFKNEYENLFQISLRTPVFLDEATSCKDDIVSIRVNTEKSLTECDIKIGLKILKSDSGRERVAVKGNEIVWNKSKQWNVGELNYPIIDGVAAQVFLSYKDRALSHTWISDKNKPLNHRMAIHKVFDSELNRLNKLLFPSKKASRDFEKGVALLLGLHGFYIAQYGEKETVQEGPDLIAESPNGDVLVIECTTGVSDITSKISKLIARAQKVRLAIESSAFSSAYVLPVLATNIENVELKSHRDSVSKFKAAITSKENILNLVDRLSFPMQANEIFEEVKSYLPKERGDAGSIAE